MTNNLKILTILSIFVLILTGYFYFSSSFTKNQTIANNNKDNKEITNINNEDSNNNEEKDSKLSILSIIVFIVILIIIIAVIVFIIVNFIKRGPEIDFRKENFCPTFFLISTSLENKLFFADFEEKGDCFFKILATCILSKSYRDVNKVEIFLGEDKVDNVCTITLSEILSEISTFAVFSKDVISNEKANEIASSYSEGIDVDKLHTTSKSIEDNYGEEFDSYLCSYLLYYLIEEMQNTKKIEKVKIHNYKSNYKENNYKKEYRTTFYMNKKVPFAEKYNVDFEIMDKILKKLLKDKPLKNVEYSQNQQEIL